MRFRLLGCDYDRTVATEGVLVERARDALAAVRASGRAVVLVTGRTMDELLDVFQELDLFDRIVVENGAVMHSPAAGEERVLCPPVSSRLRDELQRERVPLVVGRAILSTASSNDEVVRATVRALGIDCDLVYNRDSIMVLPIGCSKASGLNAAAADLGIPMEQTVAVGDGENDVALLEAAGVGVAVENAVDLLKARADIVLVRPAADGISDLCASLAQRDLADLLEASAVAS